MIAPFSFENISAVYSKMRRPDASKPEKELPIGVDGLSCAKFELHFDQNAREILRKIESGTYSFAPLLELERSKSGGGTRRLYIPRIRDQIVLRILHNEIIRIAQERGISLSQPSPYKVVSRFDFEAGKMNNPWVVRTDISAFYDSIPREDVLAYFAQMNSNPVIEKLLITWSEQLRCRKGFTMGSGQESRPWGLPPGLSISAPLSELWAQKIDEAFSPGTRYFRYVDDITILCETEQEARKQFLRLNETVNNLKLNLSPNKTTIKPLNEGVEWLGMTHFQHHKELNPEKIKNWLKPFLRHKREVLKALTETNNPHDKEILILSLIKRIESQISGKYANRVRWYSLGEDTGQWKEADRFIHEMIRSTCRNAKYDDTRIKAWPSVHAAIHRYKKLRSHPTAD